MGGKGSKNGTEESLDRFPSSSREAERGRDATGLASRAKKLFTLDFAVLFLDPRLEGLVDGAVLGLFGLGGGCT